MLNEYGRMYNNALMCPENNTFGFATIIRLRDLNYPRMYYQKNSTAYIGNYIPPVDTTDAGFNTSGKTRGMILTKLEEVLRNKQIKIYSSRFYDEMKTFVWNDNRAAAMKGENDDLVISMAIGTWLYDGSAEHSRDSSILNKAMIAGFSFASKDFNCASKSIINKEHIQKEQTRRDALGMSMPARASQISPDFLWVYKG